MSDTATKVKGDRSRALDVVAAGAGQLDRTDDAIEVVRAARMVRRQAAWVEFEAAASYAELSGRELMVDPEGRVLHGEGLVRLGGDGTPLVAEFAALELGPALRISEESAYLLMRDALMVKFRLPGLWARVKALKLEVWQAREIALITGELTAEQASWVDANVAPFASGMTKQRLAKMARALVLQVDHERAERERREQLDRRRVELFPVGDSMTGVSALIDVFDGRFVDAQLNRIAQILHEAGDEATHQQRRAKALGVLASPARALQLLQASLIDELPDDVDADCPARGHRGHVCGQVTVNPEMLMPRAEVVVHLSDHTLQQGPDDGSALARAKGLGPVLVGWLKELLGHHRVSLRPVLAAGALLPSDSYEVPARMREAIQMRNPVSVFPFSSRRSERCDLDHTQPYRFGTDLDSGPVPNGAAAGADPWAADGRPPGQTRLDNLGPLHRKAHRAKTHGGWQVSQPEPGYFLWRSPKGYRYLVTPSGTFTLARADGTDPHLTSEPDLTSDGRSHPAWLTDGEHPPSASLSPPGGLPAAPEISPAPTLDQRFVTAS